MRIYGNMELRTYGGFCMPEVMKTCHFPSKYVDFALIIEKSCEKFWGIENNTYLCDDN